MSKPHWQLYYFSTLTIVVISRNKVYLILLKFKLLKKLIEASQEHNISTSKPSFEAGLGHVRHSFPMNSIRRAPEVQFETTRNFATSTVTPLNLQVFALLFLRSFSTNAARPTSRSSQMNKNSTCIHFSDEKRPISNIISGYRQPRKPLFSTHNLNSSLSSTYATIHMIRYRCESRDLEYPHTPKNSFHVSLALWNKTT